MNNISFIVRDKNIIAYPDIKITDSTKINFFDIHLINIVYKSDIKAYYNDEHIFTIKKTTKEDVYKLFDLDINNSLNIKYCILYACIITYSICNNGILVGEDNLKFNNMLLSKKTYNKNKTLFFEQYGFIYNLTDFNKNIFDEWTKNNFIQTKTNNELIRRLYMVVFLGDKSSIVINTENRK